MQPGDRTGVHAHTDKRKLPDVHNLTHSAAGQRDHGTRQPIYRDPGAPLCHGCATDAYQRPVPNQASCSVAYNDPGQLWWYHCLR